MRVIILKGPYCIMNSDPFSWLWIVVLWYTLGELSIWIANLINSNFPSTVWIGKLHHAVIILNVCLSYILSNFWCVWTTLTEQTVIVFILIVQGYEQELQLREVSRSKLQRKGLQLMASRPSLVDEISSKLESLNQQWQALQQHIAPSPLLAPKANHTR